MTSRIESIYDDDVWYKYNVEGWTLQKILDYYGVCLMTIYYRLHPEKQRGNNKKCKEIHFRMS